LSKRELSFLKVDGLPLASEGYLDGSSLSGLFKILLHFVEESIGVGGIKVGDEKAMGLGRDGFAEAELGCAVAPTAAVGIFFLGVLSVADE
jgi:predicted anti-sigma-YlaC factor YlaD